MHRAITENTLFYGDNLSILRGYIPDESVDLVYLDPPFNSNRSYSVLFKDESGKHSEAQIEAFEDTWHWGPASEETLWNLQNEGSYEVSKAISALVDLIGKNQVMAYLVMMAARLVELHRVLKPTGSIYLHCDPTASHYLKIVMDAIFGPTNFRNEIVWRRTPSKGLSSRRLARNHDVILGYQMSDAATWNTDTAFTAYDLSALDAKTAGKYSHKDENGRLYQLSDLTNPNPDRPNLTYEFLGVTRVWRWTKERMQKAYDEGLVVQSRPGSVPRLKRYLDEQRGRPMGDVWADIEPLNSQARERLGYPTQKPEALMERVIRLSSNPGDTVLDPFCGCGTSIAAAHKLDRRWIGIDITHLSIALQKYRLEAAFPDIKFEVIGEPEDVGSARQLFEDDPYQFQWWALSLVRAKPVGSKDGKTGKKGADQGKDGVITFVESVKKSAKPRYVIVQVKGGKNVGVRDIRDLVGTVDREKAAIGVYITLADPTKPMRQEALSAGYYESPWGRFPRIQILTISELLRGAEIEMPPQHGTFKEAQRVRQSGTDHPQLDL